MDTRIKKSKINSNLFVKKKLNVFYKFSLSSILIISFFYVVPIYINFADKNFNIREFTNNSKQVLAYKLNGQGTNKDQKKVINEEDVLFDIFNLNDLESDTVD